MSKLVSSNKDPSLFAKLVESYVEEFGELFEIAEEQRDTFDRNRDILLEIVETDKRLKLLCDTQSSLVPTDFGIVSSEHPVANMGIHIFKWVLEGTKKYIKTYEPAYQLALNVIDVLTKMIRVAFIIVGSFRSVIEDGSFVPNNKLCRNIWEEVIVSMDRMYQLLSDAYKLFLADFQLGVKYEVPNRIQSIAEFLSVHLPLESPAISQRYVNILTEMVETMLANFSEFTFILLLSYRECHNSHQNHILVDVAEELADEAKSLMHKLEDKWAGFIKYSEEESCAESNHVSVQEEYIKRVKHSKEYILLKDTSKLRKSLGEFDSFLEKLENLGFDVINKSNPSDQIAEVFQDHSELYQRQLEALKSELERHELQFRILTKDKHQKLLNPTKETSTNYDTTDDKLDVPKTKDEVPVPKLEYEHEPVETDDQFLEDDSNIGDEFFQTKGGLHDSKTDQCNNDDGDSKEQEKLFKFVVRELKGKLTDVSAVMKEREKKAKRKVYGEDSSSDEEDDCLIDQEQFMSEFSHEKQPKSIGFEIEGISNPEIRDQENSLACEGFPAFLNSELRNAINLRLGRCVAEEFGSDDESDSSNN